MMFSQLKKGFHKRKYLIFALMTKETYGLEQQAVQVVLMGNISQTILPKMALTTTLFRK